MKISTRGRYALRMLLDVALHQDAGFVSLKDVAARQDISKKYLEQIIPVLTRAGLLQTSRGATGGYRLTKSPSQYTAAEVLRAAEGGLAPVSCLDGPENLCPRQGDCDTLSLWKGLEKVVTDYLESVTLQDLLDQRQSRLGDDYVI